MSDDFDCYGAEFVIVVIAQSLRRSHHDAFAGVDAEWVEVLHVADGDAVVEAVANHFVFNFLPTAERLLDEHLRRECEGFFDESREFGVVAAESAAEAAEGVGRADNHWVAELVGRGDSRWYVVACTALDGLDADLVEALHEEFAVFGVDDGSHGCAKHFDTVAFEHAASIESHAAVEGCLAAECEQDAVGAFALDDAFHKLRSDG